MAHLSFIMKHKGETKILLWNKDCIEQKKMYQASRGRSLLYLCHHLGLLAWKQHPVSSGMPEGQQQEYFYPTVHKEV